MRHLYGDFWHSSWTAIGYGKINHSNLGFIRDGCRPGRGNAFFSVSASNCSTGHCFGSGASISFDKGSTPSIRIYQDTIKDLNALEKPKLAHLFTMTHEMGHMVQGVWQDHDSKKLTPHGMISLDGDQDHYNLWHSETDCIGVELMYQAGLRAFSAVAAALE